MRSRYAVTHWHYSRGRGRERVGVLPLRALAKNELLRCEEVTMGVAFIAAARPTSVDFPSWCVVPARGAAHIHAIALEVQHRIVPPKPANQLSKTPKRPAYDAGRRIGCECRIGRELLGVIGHHGQSPCPSPFMTLRGMTPPVTRQFLTSCLRSIKTDATGTSFSGSAG